MLTRAESVPVVRYTVKHRRDIPGNSAPHVCLMRRKKQSLINSTTLLTEKRSALRSGSKTKCALGLQLTDMFRGRYTPDCLK